MRTNNLWNEQINDEVLKRAMSLEAINLQQLEQLFLIRIQLIYGCFALMFENEYEDFEDTEDTISIDDFKRFMRKMFTDETGYELANTELRIIDFIDQELTIEDQYNLGMTYIHIINSRLALITGKKIDYFLGIEDDILTIRFYQVRDEETDWFTNLESFSQAVAIISSDEIPTNIFKVEDVSEKPNV